MPGGIVSDALRSKVTWRIVPGTTAAPDPLAATATVTWPIFSGVVPKTFVSSSRTASPPTLVNTMLRTVWSSKPVAASEPGAPTRGLAAQVATQP